MAVWLSKTALSLFARGARFALMHPLRLKFASVLYEKFPYNLIGTKKSKPQFFSLKSSLFCEVEHDFFEGLSKRVTLKFSRPLPNFIEFRIPYDFAVASSCTNIGKYRSLTLTYPTYSDFKATFCALIILLLILTINFCTVVVTIA